MNSVITPAVVEPSAQAVEQSGADSAETVVVAIRVTDEQFRPYLDAIVDGRPTTGLLPVALGKLTLTDEQRAELRAARADNGKFAQANRKLIHRLTGRKCFAAASIKIAKSGAISQRHVPTDKKAAARAIVEFRAKIAAS